jgi:glutamyl-tRNA reductase
MMTQPSLVLAGLNHKTAPVALREQLAFDAGAAEQAARCLAHDVDLDEVVVLSTCNRTEVYGCTCSPPEPAAAHIDEWLACHSGQGTPKLASHLYHRGGAETVTHLLRVASGLDSLVVGEPHILGQVRTAFEVAQRAGTVDARLDRLFRTALETGRAVRSQTALGALPVSVASVAVQLAERVFGDLAGTSVLVLGAGELCAAAASHLAERCPARLAVVNRTATRAEELARRCCGEAAPWSRLDDELGRADLVVTSTGAAAPILTRRSIEAVMLRRRGRRLLIVDVAVPRDVEPAVAKVNNVYLYDIDDLQQLAAENLGHRQAEIPKAERIVQEARDRYLSWEGSLAVVPTIKALRDHLEAIRRAGVEQYVNKVPNLDEKGRRCIEQMTQTIVNRILHEPQTRLRACGDGGGPDLAASIRYLFGLGEPAGDDQP